MEPWAIYTAIGLLISGILTRVLANVLEAREKKKQARAQWLRAMVKEKNRPK